MTDHSPDQISESEPPYVHAELVEEVPGSAWEWREVRPVRPRQRSWRLPLFLFIATCLSTLDAHVSVAMLQQDWLGGILYGLRYAAPLMCILVCHELGHFLQTLRYGVFSSYPYFIPVPGSLFGTMGAVIAMEPRMGHRRALFDIGISGPLAGLVPTIIFLVIGLQHSGFDTPSKNAILFGDPLLFRFFAWWILGPTPPGREIIADPMAFAAWVGLLLTSVNLFPIGQLDGGHVLYALLRRKAHKVAKFLLFTILVTIICFWDSLWMWSLMVVLLFLMGPKHPPTADDDEPLGAWRYVLGWLTLAFIIIGFTPVPIQIP
jgi:membrane-associated protease RseP (regulator of RpoE activity)